MMYSILITHTLLLNNSSDCEEWVAPELQQICREKLNKFEEKTEQIWRG